MNVDRCVCFNITFDHLQQYVQSRGGPQGVDLDRLQSVFQCGRGCGLCTPYIQLMLRTGRTSFPVTGPATDPAMP